MKSISRSVYVAHLRRAFLLRAHPDRFRRQPTSIRKQQSVIVQALSDRMMETDFLNYASNSAVAQPWIPRSIRIDDDDDEGSHQSQLPYSLEKRDGSLIHKTLNLNSSVIDILSSLVDALHASGATKMSPPPPVPSITLSSPSSSLNDSTSNSAYCHWENSMNTKADGKNFCNASHSRIDHRYDVNTNRGRDIQAFLDSIDPSYIEERRACRMDVSAAALVARRLFSFQSVDGIRLGWSSESFVVILNSLIRLHEEHHQRFHVQSFYPSRLKFSLDEFRPHALDVYGGTIYLNPAATQLEWLESLQDVTQDRLEEFSNNRQIMEERVNMIREGTGVRVKKGFSCSSKEYHHFLEDVVDSACSTTCSTMDTSQKSALTASSVGLIPVESAVVADREWAQLVVESPKAFRGAKLTDEGSIRLPSNTSRTELEKVLRRLSQSAQNRWETENIYREKCNDIIQKLQWELGIHKIFRTGVVHRNEFLSALSRMLDQASELGGKLSGHSLGIAGRGQFCCVADDGSLIVPHNWTLRAHDVL